MNKKSDIIIIGAGVAGLVAAQELNKNGFHPLILEARNRIGGRVYTVQPWGATIELGASWIHQIHNNPLAAIAKRNNILLSPTEYSHEKPFTSLESATIYDESGKELNGTRFNIALKQIKKFTAYLDEHVPSYNENFSVDDALQEYVTKNPMNQDAYQVQIKSFLFS